jgi:hypothetical protein
VKTRILLLLLVLLIVGMTMGLAGATACPPSSKNPGGTPPNCGHPAGTSPGDCKETGPVSQPVRTVVEPIDPTGGHTTSPASGGVVHRVNCTVVWGFLGL